jgi:hypothetical protein
MDTAVVMGACKMQFARKRGGTQMKRVTAIATAALLLLVAFMMTNVRAQDFNPLEKTYLTFSGPVELPGMTLPAGTYTFKLADSPNRNVVQVLSQDEKTVHGQFLFVQAKRPDATGETVVTFKETAEGTAPAVHYWYYPGETIGKEFIYPKDQAIKIAARTHETVLSEDGPIDDSGKVAQAAPLGGGQAEAQTNQNASVPAQPTAAAGSLAGNRAQAEPDNGISSDVNAGASVGTSGQATNQVAANELPRTASPLPLSGLIGLLSLAGGYGLRAFRAVR